MDDALFLGLFLSLSHTGKYKAGLQGMMHMLVLPKGASHLPLAASG